MRHGREADQSPPFIAEVRTGGAIPPLPNTSSWHGAQLMKYRDSFTFSAYFPYFEKIKGGL
jgi:hypothetical protein